MPKVSDLPDVSPDTVAALRHITGVDVLEAGQIAGMLGFATKADMDASLAHDAGTLALVTSDPTPASNGTYRKTGASGSGSWVQSADRVSGLEGRVGVVEEELAPLPALAAAVTPESHDGDLLILADADGKEYARFDSAGSLRLPAPPRFPVDEPLKDAINRTQAAPDIDDVYVVADADGKVVLRIDGDGEIHGPRGPLSQSGGGDGPVDAGTVSAYDRQALPYRRGQTATIVSNSLIAPAIQHSTTIYGYEVGGVPVSKVITNNSLTHPKILHIPAGWNGYEYWMAVTPYFGESYGEASENPHILASHDGVSWQEIPAGPLEMAPSAPDYWSDTHLTLGDDGFLYCIYRGYGAMVGGGFKLYMKRSRDGVNWTGRTQIGSSDASVSPVMEPAQRGGFDFYEVATGITFPSGKRELTRVWLQVPGALPARTAADIAPFVNRPWEVEHPRAAGQEYDLWHFDAARIGNVYLGIMCVRTRSGPGAPELNYLCWSGDGWTWNAIPGAVGSGLYRSSIVPVSFTQNRAVLDAYLAADGMGVISVRRFTLEFS